MGAAVKIAALGDAHLGRSYYSITDPDSGVNRRELDFEDSFRAAVALALAQAPDLIVWLGDVFDHPRPTYRSFRAAQRELFRIRDHGIPTVVISGNHDTPRLPGTGQPVLGPGRRRARGSLRHPHDLRAHRAGRPRGPRRAPDDERRARPPGPRRGRRGPEPRPDQPPPDPPPRPPGGAPLRRHQRDRGRRRPPAGRPGAARPLPRAHQGHRRHVVRRLDRHLLLRRRPRPAQGHRGPRHRHRALRAPPARRPAAPGHARHRPRPRALPDRGRAPGARAGRGGTGRGGRPPLPRRGRPRGLPPARRRCRA